VHSHIQIDANMNEYMHPLLAYEAGQYACRNECEDFTYAWIAADICTRNLDGGNHTQDEAVRMLFYGS
jgi:hypothetical protein